MSKMREKESLECVRMHIWALKTQKLPGPRQQIACFTRTTPLRYVGNFRPQKLGPPLTKSWIRTCESTMVCLSFPFFPVSDCRKFVVFPLWINVVKQECIPVGCVPPAAVAISGGGLHTHSPEADTPLGVGTPGAGTPRSRPPRSRTPGADPPSRHPPRAGTPPVNRMTDRQV